MLQNFNYEGVQIRTTTDASNEVWFAGIDVCNILEYAKADTTITSILDEDERKLEYLIDTSGQRRKTWTINESGLYHLIITSTKPEAKRFRKWITGEVLPAIRKAGVYSTEDAQQREIDLQQITKLLKTKKELLKVRKSELRDLKHQIDEFETRRDGLITDYRQMKIKFPALESETVTEQEE